MSVRTVTTVHTAGDNGPTDSSLDALLEDLQTSVSRNTPGIVNGINNSGNTKVYREVTRTVTKAKSTPAYQQVEYLAPANTTTVVTERSTSPGGTMLQSGPGNGVTQFKTVSYQYNTSSSSNDASGAPVSDAKLRKNLNELDSLLVDLHHAQKTGFSATGSQGRSRSTDVVPHTRGGIDSGLLESLDAGAPQRQVTGHVTRTYHTYNTRQSSSPQRYTTTETTTRTLPYSTTETISKTVPVNRELVFTDHNRSSSLDHAHHRTAHSPSPLRREESPHAPRRSGHKEVYYETKTTNSGSGRQSRSTSSPQHEPRYRDKSPSGQRLHREIYNYETSDTTRHQSVPVSQREMSPPSQRRNQSPSPHRHTENRVFNTYSTTTNSSTTTSPRPYRSPSPISREREPPIIDGPRRSPSPTLGGRHPTPPTKVTTTVRTYTYELPPGVEPGPGYNSQGRDYPDRPVYQSTPVKDPEPTVITYKYSSHQSSRTNNTHDQPRPFPTPSPQPGQNPNLPKKVDELMAQFGDTTDISYQQRTPQHYTAPPPTPPPAPPAEKSNGSLVQSKVVEAPVVRSRGNSKNVAGPPVYYPPGVELFARKDDQRMMSTKASGEYEMSRESQSKGSSGGAGVVPVCLPVCCAMPCTIM